MHGLEARRGLSQEVRLQFARACDL
jgi:hypothetical protein